MLSNKHVLLWLLCAQRARYYVTTCARHAWMIPLLYVYVLMSAFSLIFLSAAQAQTISSDLYAISETPLSEASVQALLAYDSHAQLNTDITRYDITPYLDDASPNPFASHPANVEAYQLAIRHSEHQPQTDIGSTLSGTAKFTASLADTVEIPPARRMPTPCTEEAVTEEEELPWLDRTHLRLSQSLCNQVRRFDQFFGDVNFEEQYNKSFMRIRNSVVWENTTSTELKFRPRVRAKIRLPNAEDKLNLIITDDSQDPDTLSSATEIEPEQSNSDNNVSTALRWVARKSRALELNFDVGARIDDGLTTFVRGRYRKQFALSNDRSLRFTETLYWRDREGFGERTQVDLEKLINPNLVARWTSAGTFSEDSEGFEWTQRLTLFKQIDPLRAIAYNIGAVGHTRPAPEVDNYGISVRYRKNVYSHWLYAEVEPELNWPLETDRDIAPKITFRLEVQLGKSKF